MSRSHLAAYENARLRYAALGVDTELALECLAHIPVSLHCWQGDDVAGFEGSDTARDGGLAVTGNYPGKARNADELRADLEKALSLIPGRHRINLHACYAETDGRKVDRNALAPEHFARWRDWALGRGLSLDFNPSFFAHRLAGDGFTLSHGDATIRQLWIEHGIACRRIAAHFGAAQGSPCVTNVWVPDGYKDTPVDRKTPRERLAESLDAMFAEAIDPRFVLDAVESKLFGIGSESYVVGSHEFYLGYALSRKKLLCLDAGHFHPTESVADKISSVLQWSERLLLHVSRGVRWDSDHVVTLNDELAFIAQEVVRGGFLGRVHLGLDFFDASINRIAAWVIGSRALIQALLRALLEPIDRLRSAEQAGDYTTRLALQEESRSLPFGAVWDMACERGGVPAGLSWLEEVKAHERDVLSLRG